MLKYLKLGNKDNFWIGNDSYKALKMKILPILLLSHPGILGIM